MMDIPISCDGHCTTYCDGHCMSTNAHVYNSLTYKYNYVVQHYIYIVCAIEMGLYRMGDAVGDAVGVPLYLSMYPYCPLVYILNI